MLLTKVVYKSRIHKLLATDVNKIFNDILLTKDVNKSFNKKQVKTLVPMFANKKTNWSTRS